ncbi:MAG: hypothetical protein ACREGJ_04595 [Candidatus Saccharimonadales bacterium]
MYWGNTYPFAFARLWRCVLFIFAFSFVAAAFSLTFSLPARAATGINERLNYQARLLDNSGAVVPDGTYNIEFKIYQDGTGCEASGIPPCSGTLKWTETRISTDRVTVTNGYFSAQLGSVTAFGSSVDWNQDTLWLSINVGGTSGTPSWDGEMTPFRRLGATPYALNAKQLGGLDWSKFVQVAPSAVQTDGTTLSTLFLNKTGASGNILQLQKNGSDVMVLTNGGALTLQNSTDSVTALRVLNAAGSSVFNVDTTNGRVGIGGIAGFSKFEVIDGEAAIYNNGNNPRLILGDSTTAGENGYLQWDSTNNYFRIESVGTNGLKINDNYVAIGNIFPDQPLKIANGSTLLAQVNTTGQAFFQNSSNSTSAFRVLNAGGTSLLTVDTSNSQTIIAGTGTNGAGGRLYFGTDSLVYAGEANITDTNQFQIAGWGGIYMTTGFINSLVLDGNGAATFQASDGTTAFRVLNNSGVPQFVIDTTNSRSYVGNPTADSTGALLVLDTKNTAGDPTGVNGSMYYNSNSGKFRCYQGSSWEDCIGTNEIAWTNLTIQAPAADGLPGNSLHRLRRLSTGQVELQLDVDINSATSGDIIASLPTWARPLNQLRFPIATNASSTATFNAHMDLNTNGDVKIFSANISSLDWLDLTVVYTPVN